MTHTVTKTVAKTYRVKEIFYTLQGEGAQAGRPSVFCRFSKCNLWNGKEASRAQSVCDFCDTDFVGTDGENGGIYTAVELVQLISLQIHCYYNFHNFTQNGFHSTIITRS